MRYQHLGKTHHVRLPLIHARVRIIFIIAAVVSAPLALIAKAFWPEGPGYAALYLAIGAFLFCLCRCWEVPFTRELWWHPFRFRVAGCAGVSPAGK